MNNRRLRLESTSTQNNRAVQRSAARRETRDESDDHRATIDNGIGLNCSIIPSTLCTFTLVVSLSPPQAPSKRSRKAFSDPGLSITRSSIPTKDLADKRINHQSIAYGTTNPTYPSLLLLEAYNSK
jgi:hypothetical protein